MKTLTQTEIEAQLPTLHGWSFDGQKLTRSWTFPDFLGAMAFVNQVAPIAEAAQHHPDIDIRYNQVTLGLISHDANGITNRDVSMAKHISDHFAA